jgi:hypothetical protein
MVLPDPFQPDTVELVFDAVYLPSDGHQRVPYADECVDLGFAQAYGLAGAAPLVRVAVLARGVVVVVL